VLEVVLEDVSLADAKAVEIARIEVPGPGNPPYDFSIEFDPETIQDNHTYSVRARVLVGKRLLFTSDTQNPVITRGAPLEVDILMVRVGKTPDQASLGLNLPATFKGKLPCADCEELKHQLNLWPDRVFHLHRAWIGTDLTQDAVGLWSVDPSRNALILSAGEDKLEFEVVAPDRLRLIGRDGAALVGEGNTELLSAGGIKPMDLHLPVRGTVRYLADSARITECLTGRDYPLAVEGDFATLEAAYLAAGVPHGSPLMASFDGTITERPRANGDGTQPAVIVEKFTGVWPDETCEPVRTDASLTNTYWKILRLGDAEIAAGEDRTEPSLTLNESEARVSATVGCNQMAGGFNVDGDRRDFGPMVTTMMACQPPLDDWDRRLADVLGATTRWRIDGQALELLDAEGTVIALLEAEYLR
jgi:heat shock protein HslJ/uncharacterized lipoprotein NlpE involved in copper resistance